jgi:hypothetical protein
MTPLLDITLRIFDILIPGIAKLSIALMPSLYAPSNFILPPISD